ncbi:unnamed protein product [Heligmosomoides polygyrus]|uniref:Secreted protein n=1 Tax=Heligmosomoides polygyrus TaxID=6339 RepID=A0A183GKB7_HELPZ|nr:unnamed protein product [Heligmosomoides polygyrus]
MRDLMWSWCHGGHRTASADSCDNHGPADGNNHSYGNYHADDDWNETGGTGDEHNQWNNSADAFASCDGGRDNEDGIAGAV